jgi:hypothetical protein
MQPTPDRPGTNGASALRRHGVVVDLEARASARRALREEELRCVSSGYMSGECSCARTVPAAVAAAAWAGECEKATGNRFFHFAWQGHVWLAFGLSDGGVRGVYCPTHRAEREPRSSGCEAQHYAPAAAVGA